MVSFYISSQDTYYSDSNTMTASIAYDILMNIEDFFIKPCDDIFERCNDLNNKRIRSRFLYLRRWLSRNRSAFL